MDGNQSLYVDTLYYRRSFVSTFLRDKKMQSKETIIKIIGKTILPERLKSPILPCKRKIKRNDVMIVAFEDFMAKPTNRTIKLTLTVTMDFRIN